MAWSPVLSPNHYHFHFSNTNVHYCCPQVFSDTFLWMASERGLIQKWNDPWGQLVLANLSSDRDWNNECLVAGDRCYHSPERQKRIGLSLPVIYEGLWHWAVCVCLRTPWSGRGGNKNTWKVWLLFSAKPNSSNIGGMCKTREAWQAKRWREFTAP